MQTRQSWQAANLRRYWPVLAVAALLPVAALAVYAAIGAPSLASAPTPAPAPMADWRETDGAELHAQQMLADGLADGLAGGHAAGDLPQAIERLRARLELEPHDAAGWRLLAQSYAYLGQEERAADANRRAAAAEAGTVPTAPRPDASVTDLAAQAQRLRHERKFHAANQAFAELARRGEMDADTWADYADSVGAEHGALTEEALPFIDHALRLDPRHAKALWLRGTWQTQRRDYAGALATWQRLASVLPPDSPDARFIADNISEARVQLASSGSPVR